MENSINNRQLAFILYLTLTTSSAISIQKTMTESAGVGSWVTIMTTAFIFALLVVVIVKLNNMFRGKVLFEYSSELIGKVGSIIIAVFYIIYFLSVSVKLSSFYTNLVKSELLYKTPAWAISFIIISVCGYAAYKGITNVARLFEILGILFLFAAGTVHIMMLLKGNIMHILPLYIPSETGKYFMAIKDAIFPFLGIEVLFIIPFTEKNGKRASKIAFLTLLAIGIFYVFEITTTIMMVGINEIVYYQFPAFVAIRQVEIAFIDFLRRFDMLFLLIVLMSCNAGIIITYLSVVEFLCRLLTKAKRVVIVIITGLVIFILRLITLEINVYDKIFDETIIYIGLISAVFIPITLFIIAKMKKVEKSAKIKKEI